MADPLGLLAGWLADARAASVVEPDAMTVATVGPDGSPSARVVLLRGVDRGIVFYTNRTSRKARDLAADPRAAAVLVWPALGRQVRVVGACEETSAEESDAYWATRPRGSQLAAWASPQSEVLPGGRDELLALAARVAARFPEGELVPRPPHWGGYRLVPAEVELWTRGPDRLHHRERYTAEPGGWRADVLAP